MRNDKSSVWVFCFFFKQKTAYEMRISDWSSDVCSSDLFERGFVEAVQHQHLRPAEQRGVEREAGVFGRGADEHDRAALDEGQEAVLLRTIEAVYLVDEQQGALARRRHLLGIGKGLLEVGDPREDRRQRREAHPDRLGEQDRKRTRLNSSH